MKLDCCFFCRGRVDERLGTPYSICYDPEWRVNIWGGDTHRYLAYICEACALSRGLALSSDVEILVEGISVGSVDPAEISEALKDYEPKASVRIEAIEAYDPKLRPDGEG